MKWIPLPLSVLLWVSIISRGDTVTVHGDPYPVTEERFGATWQLAGTHHYRYKIVFSVFTGAYYRQQDGEGERLVFTYTRNLKADDLRAQAMKQLRATNAADMIEGFREPLTELQQAYTDVSDHDSYAITVLPGTGVRLERNGEVVFQSGNAEFGDWYIDIWLGDPPIDKGLKKALMGG